MTPNPGTQEAIAVSEMVGRVAEASKINPGFEATLHQPTGFRAPEHEHVMPVRVLGFAAGTHEDAGGYGRRAECILAIIARDTGYVSAVPASWLRLPMISTAIQEKEV